MDRAEYIFLSPLPHLYVLYNQGTECPHRFRATAGVCSHFKEGGRSYNNITTQRQQEGSWLSKNVNILKLLISKNKHKRTQGIEAVTQHDRKTLCSNCDKVVADYTFKQHNMVAVTKLFCKVNSFMKNILQTKLQCPAVLAVKLLWSFFRYSTRYGLT